TNITLADANSLSASITALGVGDLNAVAGALTVDGSTVGNLTTNSSTSTSVGVPSAGGARSTVAGTDEGQTGTLTVAGTSSLTATAGDIDLGTLTNAFPTRRSSDLTNITLADANSLSASITALGVGDLNAVAGALTVDGSTVGNLTTNSGTSTSFGVTSVGGALSTMAGADVGPTGTVRARGPASAREKDGDI